MAVYKVIQDIEAEDKLLGPLTLKGFIYALIAGFLAFLNFKLLVTTELGVFRWFLMFVFSMPMLLFGVLASPLGREQPTEVWLLSRIRFFLQPKRRMWDQSGISQLVTITAPPKTERVRTKDLSQSQVRSRLRALATTMDTRGWAVKNSSVNLSSEPGYLEGEAGDSDRLIGVSSLPDASLSADVRPADDIMDEQNNPTAKHFWDMLRIKDVERKQKMADRLKAVREEKPPASTKGKQPAKPKRHHEAPAGRPQPAYHVPKDEDLLNLKFQEAEKAFRAEHPQDKKQETGNKEQEIENGKRKTESGSAQPTTVTAGQTADKLELAQSGNDLSVASIQKLANRQPRVEQVSPGEVVISFR